MRDHCEDFFCAIADSYCPLREVTSVSSAVHLCHAKVAKGRADKPSRRDVRAEMARLRGDAEPSLVAWSRSPSRATLRSRDRSWSRGASSRSSVPSAGGSQPRRGASPARSSQRRRGASPARGSGRLTPSAPGPQPPAPPAPPLHLTPNAASIVADGGHWTRRPVVEDRGWSDRPRLCGYGVALLHATTVHSTCFAIFCFFAFASTVTAHARKNTYSIHYARTQLRMHACTYAPMYALTYASTYSMHERASPHAR